MALILIKYKNERNFQLYIRQRFLQIHHAMRCGKALSRCESEI